MTIDRVREGVLSIVERYPISKVELFGSTAAGTNRPDSDVDLIIEFYKPISLLTLSSIKCELEDILHTKVDVIHGPIQEDDMIRADKVVELYAA